MLDDLPGDGWAGDGGHDAHSALACRAFENVASERAAQQSCPVEARGGGEQGTVEESAPGVSR